MDEDRQTVEALFCGADDVEITATSVSGETQADLPCSEEILMLDDELRACYIPGLFLRSCLVPILGDATQIRFTLNVPSCDCQTTSPCEVPESPITVSPRVPNTCTPMINVTVVNGEAAQEEACNQKYTGACQEELTEECSSRKQIAAKTVNDTCSSQIVQSKEKCSKESDASQVDSVKKKNAAVVKVEEECKVRMSGACGKL